MKITFRGFRLFALLVSLQVCGMARFTFASPILDFSPFEVGAGSQVSVRGQLLRKGWSLIVGTTPVRVAPDGSFRLKVTRTSGNALKWMAVDPWGGIQTGSVTLPDPAPSVPAGTSPVVLSPLKGMGEVVQGDRQLASVEPQVFAPVASSEDSVPTGENSNSSENSRLRLQLSLGNRFALASSLSAVSGAAVVTSPAKASLSPSLKGGVYVPWSLFGRDFEWRSEVRVSAEETFRSQSSGTDSGVGYIDGSSTLQSRIWNSATISIGFGAGVFTTASFSLSGAPVDYGFNLLGAPVLTATYGRASDEEITALARVGLGTGGVGMKNLRLSWTGSKLWGWKGPFRAHRWGLELDLLSYGEEASKKLLSGASYVLTYQRSEATLSLVLGW